MLAVPEPFVAYLRVYEPLSSFDSAVRERLSAELERGPVSAAEVGLHEQHAWLRTQVAKTPQLLPGELPDGTAREDVDVLALEAEKVPRGPSTGVGPDPLVCPLDLRGRSAAALIGFLGNADPPLRSSVLVRPPEAARAHASAVAGDEASSAVHVLSSTWTVPLPWFALVDPTEREDGERDGRRTVRWRAAMADARRRVARAHAVAQSSLGDEGPTKILLETGRWLERFHPHSAVELDYGGLVQLMSSTDFEVDTSAEDVHAIIDAMELGDAEEVGERYEQLRDFWSRFAAHEHYN